MHAGRQFDGDPYHLAQVSRGLLLGGPVAGPLARVLGLAALMLAALVPGRGSRNPRSRISEY